MPSRKESAPQMRRPAPAPAARPAPQAPQAPQMQSQAVFDPRAPMQQSNDPRMGAINPQAMQPQPPQAMQPQPPQAMQPQPGMRAPGMKKGGKVPAKDWEGSAEDEAQDKKLAKKHGMSMSKWEKSKMDDKHDKQQSMKGLKKGGVTKAKKMCGGGMGYKAGGVISSKRGDGCATKGKTRCRIR